MSLAVLDRYNTAIQKHLLANAARINRSFATGLRPPEKLSVSDWAGRYRRFSDDSAYPGPWRHATAPYLVEIMDRLSPHDPAETISILKCAQSGGSASAENWVGYIADIAPGPLMYVQATITAAKDWLAEKLWPMVEATPRLNPDLTGAIMGRKSRDGDGTTALRVRFRKGSWLLIAGANSAATLRAHSIRYVVEDDLDQFPDDLDNQGSPEGMVTARQRVYARQGLSKRLKISTGTIKGASKIGRAYEASDQRRLYLQSPHSGQWFDPVFSDLVWPSDQPAKAYMLDPTCAGLVIEHYQKQDLLQTALWIPTSETETPDGDKIRPPRIIPDDQITHWRTRPMGGLQPGYHITGIISSFLTWSQLATGFVAAQGNVNALKTWTNLELGELFEYKGDAPPAESLEILREQDWGRGQVPWGPCVFTMGCDIQGDGIYYLTNGHGPESETWCLDFGFLPGPTDVPGQGAWLRLDELVRRGLTLPGGKTLEIDQVCVDAGYHTESAKAFCKGHPNRMPVFGRPGWFRPLLGRGEATQYISRGRRAGRATGKADDKAFLVGTFGAKATFYGYVRASLKAAEARARGETPGEIRGRLHFGREADANLFGQLTSETCVTETTPSGIPARIWKVISGRQNHWLDCAIYSMAATEALRLDGLSHARWGQLQAERCAAPDPSQGDLVQLMRQPAAAETPPARPANPVRDTSEPWIKLENKDWF
jgi:phage terminase large subunit GpA-like protein